MGWVVNQIWIGSNPPVTQLKATQQQAKAFGWEYRFWDWEELTSTFGYFYFRNFLIEKLTDTALTFLSKFYMWHILTMCKDHGIYLDATRSFPFTEVYGEYTFARPGIYTPPTYQPWFIACSQTEAAEVARDQVVASLDLRYRANRDRMFKFFLTSKYNVIGQRYFQNTLIPLWRGKKIKVYNNINPFKTSPIYNDIPDYLIPSVAFGSTGNISITPAAHNIMVAAVNRKIKPLITLAPVNVKRIIIVGEDVMGITDLDVIAQRNDLFIHVDSCPLFNQIEWVENIYHSVYFTKESLVPKEVRNKKEELVNYSHLLPSSSFYGYKWMQNVVSPISPRIALACAYKELNPNIPILLYGYNVADNITHGYDPELEEVLAKQSGVEIIPPFYDLLFLIISRKGNIIRRVNIRKTWLSLLPDKFTYRFIHSGKKGREDHIWAFTGIGDDEKDEEVGMKVYAGLLNASQMRFSHLFIIPDDGEVSPLTLWNWIQMEHPTTFGVRRYDKEEDVLSYVFNYGIGLSSEAVSKLLTILSPDVAKEMKARPDMMLAHAIKSCGLATLDASPVLMSQQ